jgi:glycosyltransferase involved in cell wall biosynthesis
LEEHVVSLGFVAQEDMPFLYGAAEFVIYASLWEGFGFPVVEAFAARKALTTSRNTSLPEVAGEACLAVDPYSVEEIASAILKLHSDETAREQLALRGS